MSRHEKSLLLILCATKPSEYEKFIAHYTNITVSKMLLKMDENLENISPIRLNTINLMNDPEEGMLINSILGLDKDITTDDLSFVACFTLHHDSLNQFRLYCKEEKNEALGLSLVLNNNLFSPTNNTRKINDRDFLEVSDLERSDASLILDKLPIMPLYRCIYFDSSSGLIKVAQREKWSFWREFKSGDKDLLWFENNELADGKWGEYIHGVGGKDGIKKIEDEVKDELLALSKSTKNMILNKINSEQKELLAEILLPLRYLIKHMAFKEEQECRIVYVTQMDNSLIKYDEKMNRIYIDYEPSVMEHLEKIYLAPKAADEKMVFEYLCSQGMKVRQHKIIKDDEGNIIEDGKVRVKISQNPFR